MNSKEYSMIPDFLIELEQINYLEVLQILNIVVIGYASNKAIDTYTLHKQQRPKNIKKVNISPELKVEYNDVDINRIVNIKFGESLREFSEVMIKNFSKEDLINFYNNINTLKISHSNFKLVNVILKYNIEGVYRSRKNKITIDENDLSAPIYHELLHMASSVYKDGIKYSGFHQTYLKLGITNLGNAINEGYTELLCRRYFNSDTVASNSYEYEKDIAESLEQIIGKEKMESLYLNANLFGLIQEMKQFSSEQEVMKFISNTDFVFRHLDNKKVKLIEKEMLTKALNNINKFLIKSYSNKLLQQFHQNWITSEQLTTQLAQYVSSLTSVLTIGKRSYKILSEGDLTECFDSVFGISNITFKIKQEEKLSSTKNK